MEQKICEICGKEFTPRHHRQLYCTKECANESEKQNKIIRKRRPKVVYEKKNQELVEMTVKARELGMTYGQYVAMIEGGAKYETRKH